MLARASTQVRMTKTEHCMETRITASETLAYLIEMSANLQRIASISNHLISNMASFLHDETNDSSSKPEGNTSNSVTKETYQAAFRVFTALGANDEEIRKKIIETNHLVGYHRLAS